MSMQFSHNKRALQLVIAAIYTALVNETKYDAAEWPLVKGLVQIYNIA